MTWLSVEYVHRHTWKYKRFIHSEKESALLLTRCGSQPCVLLSVGKEKVRCQTTWPHQAWRRGGRAVASTGSGGPLCLAPLWELQEARFGWGSFLPSFCRPDQDSGRWVMVAGGPVGCTKPHLVHGTALRLLFGILALRTVLQTCFAEEASHGRARGGRTRTFSRPLLPLWYLWPRSIGTDSPRARCQARGSRWFCTFLKRLLSENINCRLTTQKRPL